MTTQFDSYAASYREEVDRAISFIGKDVEFFAERKAEVLEDAARRHLGDPSELAVLDVGCGIGLVDGYLTSRFGTVAGVDVSVPELAVAASLHPGVAYAVSEPRRVPHPAGGFDLAFAACVLHHLGARDQSGLIDEMRRVVRPGGLVVVFEHNPLNPLTRLVVSRVSFDADVELLRARRVVSLFAQSGLVPLQIRNMTFLPWRSRFAQTVEARLSWVPIGAQYAVLGRRADA